MNYTAIALSLFVFVLTACSPAHDRARANAVVGPGYPVDGREDIVTAGYKPLNGLTLGDDKAADQPHTAAK